MTALIVRLRLTGADLGGAVLTGPADLSAADFTDANATGAQLSSADLSSATVENTDLDNATVTGAGLAGTDLTTAQLTGLTDANLTEANLDGAYFDDTTLTGVTWSDTTCPDGTNSNQHDSGCNSPLNLTPPVAHPYFPASEVNGWFNAPATVDWDWSDAGPLNPALCPATSITTGNGLQTLSASCTDLAGNSSSDTVQVHVDTTRPAVTLKGVMAEGHYALGAVPAACVTQEPVSGVGQPATVHFSGGRDGVGAITVTCSGAISVAGLSQPAPVQTTVTVGYGFGGFTTPAPGAGVTPGRSLTVRFELTAGRSTPIGSAAARSLAKAHDIRAMLAGPGSAPVTAACSWAAAGRDFTCAIRLPAKIRTGHRNKYTLTAEENVGTGFFPVPSGRKAANPETISFR